LALIENQVPRTEKFHRALILDLGNSPWIVVRLYVNRIAAAITAAKPDTCAE
jgi:hypothetical protein